MRKNYSLSALIIFVFSTLLGFGTLPVNASGNLSRLDVEEKQRSTTLLTFSPSLTNYLPIIMKPPVAPTVNVVSSSAYDSDYGSLYIVGEVINNTPNNVIFVRVTATLHNSSGAVIRSDYSYTLVDVIAPGEKAPFRISFYDYPTEYTEYQLSVSYSAAVPSAKKSGVLVLSSSTWDSGYGSIYTVGEVQNNTSSNVSFVKVIATYYDAAGMVTNVDYTYTTIDVIGISQKSPFKIYADDRPYNSYTIVVDFTSTTNLPPSGASVINLYEQTDFGSTQLTGEIQNNSGNNIFFTKVIATYYDNVGVVTDVDYDYLPLDIVGSGQKGCFKIYGTDRPYDTYTLISDFSVTSNPTPNLEVLSITPTGDLHLAGQIRNNHLTETYNFVKAVGTLYNGTGKVINCEYSYTSPSEISPGGIAPYDINFYSHTTGWTNYSVIASD